VTEYERGCDCGGITKITKPNGAEITMTYDGKGNLLSRIEQINEQTSATWTYQYHPTLNKITKIIDPENNDTAFTYNGDGNLLKITDALDNETVFEYNDQGLVTLITDALGHSSTITYDTVGNLETSSDNSGNVTSYGYDSAGNITEITKGTGTAEEEITTYTYDDMNRLLSSIDALNNTTTYTYDGNGNILTVVDAETNATINVYDEANRRIRITDAENHQTDFGYDSNGNLTTVTDADLHTTTYTYDQLNRLIQKTYHDGKSFTYTYDEVGNKITETDPNENTITFDYDYLNRLTTKTYPDESTETYTYDKLSRMLTGTNADSTLTYSYDDLGRIENATLNGKTINYGYDDLGNRTTLTTPESAIVEYIYNSGNLMTRMQIASNSKGIDYSYDALHRVVRKDYTGGSYSTYGFDDAGRLESIIHKRSDESVIYTQINTPDNVGNIISKTTGLGTTTYWYDEIYQLTVADHPAQTDESFTYDPVGNRLTSLDYTDWDYNSRNQLTGYNGVTYTYDDNGNTTSKTDAEGTANYTYNYENRLTGIDFPGGGYATYKYDVKGRRIEKNVNGTVTKYLYDGDSSIAEYNGSGILQRNYFYGAGDINPSILFENSNVYYYYHDHLNTPQAVTNESGTVVWDATYKSFGEVNITVETVSNNFRFPGQYYDAESGLHYNYFRYYDSSTGRYLREDPIGLKNGMNHLYVYVQNNPINWIDPFGLDCGPGQVGDFIFPDFWFKKACREHDVCYRDCCAKKEDCDDEFCKKLNDRCRQMKLWNPLRYTCFAAAQSYCNAPKTPIGTWRFNDAQKKCE